ncbi:MAG: type II secretion system protein [Desulfuromonas sp.]|nr:type II secretion system protein [Desulfuromonas sp.]
MNNQKGFTLIELIVVIVILGILAAVALPKFVDLSSEAEKSTVEGARGAVKAASALAHATWLVKGKPATIIAEGVVIDIINGYPSADDADTNDTIAEMAGLDESFTVSDDSGTNATMTITNGSYSFTYKEATSATVPPVISVVN